MAQLQKLYNLNLRDPVQSPYNLLLDKAVLFFLDAILHNRPIEKLEEFIATSLLLLSPIEDLLDSTIKSKNVLYKTNLYCNRQQSIHTLFCFSSLSKTGETREKLLNFLQLLLSEIKPKLEDSTASKKTHYWKCGVFGKPDCARWKNNDTPAIEPCKIKSAEI